MAVFMGALGGRKFFQGPTLTKNLEDLKDFLPGHYTDAQVKAVHDVFQRLLKAGVQGIVTPEKVQEALQKPAARGKAQAAQAVPATATVLKKVGQLENRLADQLAALQGLNAELAGLKIKENKAAAAIA